MQNVFGRPEKASMKIHLFDIGVSILEKTGWKVERVQGSGKSSVRRITKGTVSKVVSIRTTQDTWIAFPRTEKDGGWRTLAACRTEVFGRGAATARGHLMLP
jgi:hypothetical protein